MNRHILLCCLFLITAGGLFAQNAENGFAPPAEDSVFIISGITFDIKGRTRPDAVIRNAELKEGEEIQGRANLEKYIQEKQQFLQNQRIFDSAKITRSVGEVQKDGKYPVSLHISIVDTWNIIAVPYPKYDTNSGFEFIVKARDYNFMGTMNPLRLDFGYKYDQKGQSSVVFELDSDTPFRAFGFNWNIDFDHFFNYRPDAEEPYFYKNITGLSMELPFKTTLFTFGFEESFVLNEENDDSKLQYGKFQNGLYMASRPYVIWEIPTGLDVGNYGELTYTPEISAVFNHEFSQWPLHDFRKGPFLSLIHTLGFNQINWIGNYRQGFDVGMKNSYVFDFHRMSQDKESLSIEYSVSGKGHFIITGNFGISTFLQYRHWFYHDPGYYTKGGDALRGILDSAINADYMLSLNLDFPFRVLQFLPSRWFGKPRLRIIDFDLHLSPIVDMALYHDPLSNTAFSFKNILVSGGMELIVFPAFMRSLYIRVSIAWNFVDMANNPSDYYPNPIVPIIPHLPAGNNREIFIGIGHHY
jgi:hypothetical protein